MGASISIRRTATVGVTLTLAAALLAACGDSNSDATTSGGSSNGKVAAVIKGLDNPFFQSMEKGINDQATSSGTSTTVQAATAITDTTGQADKLTALAGQDFSCFVVNPISGTNLVQGLAKVAAAKKTIINIDSPIDAAAAKAAGATIATYIGTNNETAGETAAAEMIKLVSTGKVAAIGGVAGDVTSGARITGFTTGIGSTLTLTQTVAANWNRQEALTAATTILQSTPDLKGFFVANDDMGLGVVRAVANAKKTGQVRVISVDGISDALTSIKDGGLDATVAQYPYTIGQMGVEACQAVAAGKTLPANVDAPVELVTKADAEKALAATPKPFGTFDDPIAALLK